MVQAEEKHRGVSIKIHFHYVATEHIKSFNAQSAKGKKVSLASLVLLLYADFLKYNQCLER